jgi:hypothetical protein
MMLTDERATQAVKSALAWMRAHNVKWLQTEDKIYSKQYEYAGTMDGLAYVDSCTDPACCREHYTHRLCLIDWKTSNTLKLEYCLQTAAYQQALQEEKNTPIESRWVLRLGKSEEEAGKFEPWFLSNDDFKTDLEGFLACLRLTRLVDSVEARMKAQKGTIRAVKKEQKATAKAIAKEQEKLQKAMDKAAAKLVKEAEKVRIKAEAKAERERLKLAKKNGRDAQVEVQQTVNLPLQASIAGSIPATPTITEPTFESVFTPLMEKMSEDLTSAIDEIAAQINAQEEACTFTSKEPAIPEEKSTLSDSTRPTETSTKSKSLVQETTSTPNPKPPSASTTSTAEINTQHGPGFYEETETYVPTFNIPMEG